MVARNDRLEHTIPAIGTVHVAGTQSAAFQISSSSSSVRCSRPMKDFCALLTRINSSRFTGPKFSLACELPHADQQRCERSFCAFALNGVHLFVFEQRRRQAAEFGVVLDDQYGSTFLLRLPHHRAPFP